MALIGSEYMTSPKFTPVTGEVCWLHHRLYPIARTTVGNDILIQGYDTDGNLLFDVKKVFNVTSYQCVLKLYHDAGSGSMNATFPLNQDYLNGVDIMYEATASSMTATLYINSAEVASVTHGSNTTGWGQVAYTTMGPAFVSGANALRFSEFIIADGDTRNARLNLLRPTAEGGETDWSGLVTDLSDDDPTTGMTTTLIDQRQAVQVGAYTGAGNVSAVIVASQSLAGEGGPQNMRHTVRMGAVNYDSPADIPLDVSLQYELTNFLINPGTSLPWTGADLAVMEMGFISKT